MYISACLLVCLLPCLLAVWVKIVIRPPPLKLTDYPRVVMYLLACSKGEQPEDGASAAAEDDENAASAMFEEEEQELAAAAATEVESDSAGGGGFFKPMLKKRPKTGNKLCSWSWKEKKCQPADLCQYKYQAS